MPMNFLGGGSLEKIIIHVVLYLQATKWCDDPFEVGTASNTCEK
jgi:hypothetical protein